MAMLDPRTATKILGSSIITGAILYVVVDQVLTSQSISGGLWDLGKFLISVVPVGFAVYYIFS